MVLPARNSASMALGKGEPLSPLIFAADLLQAIISKALYLNLLHFPIPMAGKDFPIVLWCKHVLFNFYVSNAFWKALVDLLASG